jgi:hypothetical protein
MLRFDILIQTRDENRRRFVKQILVCLLKFYDAKVLNDINATTDLLDKRGEIYSSRPRFVVSYVA